MIICEDRWVSVDEVGCDGGCRGVWGGCVLCERLFLCQGTCGLEKGVSYLDDCMVYDIVEIKLLICNYIFIIMQPFLYLQLQTASGTKDLNYTLEKYINISKQFVKDNPDFYGAKFISQSIR